MTPFQQNTLKYGQEAEFSRGDLARVEEVLRMIGTGHRVLDIGCHSGLFGDRIRRSGNEVVSLDIVHHSCRLAKEKELPAVQADMMSPLPFQNKSFDTVFSGETIEHVYDTDGFLSEMHRVLVPGGSLVITTPNLGALGRRLLLLFGKNPHMEVSAFEDPDTRQVCAAGHIRYFLRNTLSRLLCGNGFLPEDWATDVINFSANGKYFSRALAKRFPSLGRAIIVKATKKRGVNESG